MISSVANSGDEMHQFEHGGAHPLANRIEREKRAAAEAAVQLVQDGMVVGLGTGSTAEFAIRLLGERVKAGLSIVGVPTSRWAEDTARSCGLDLLDLQSVPRVDLTIDGADEIDRATLNVLKGRGGALVREKLVATASDQVIIIADSTKLVDKLGFAHPIPVEVLPFGWRVPIDELRNLGGQVRLRTIAGGTSPFISDNGNYILDVMFGMIDDSAGLAETIKGITGVLDHGLFIGLADQALVASDDRVDTFTVGR